MRILYLTDDFPPEALGGAGIIAYEEAKGMKRKGHEIFVVTTSQKNHDLKEVYDGMQVFRMYSNYDIRWRAYKSLYNRKIVKKLNSILTEIKPDVIHVHNIHTHLSYASLKTAKKCCPKVFLTLHDVMTVNYGKWSPKQGDKVNFWQQWFQNKFRFNPIRNIMIRHYLKYADRLFCVSDTLRMFLVNNGIREITTLHNGIDLEAWKIEPDKLEQFQVRFDLNNKKVLFFGGRLSNAKGVGVALDLLNETAKTDIETVLLIAGSESAEAALSLKDRAKKMGLENKIKFTGWLQREEMRYALSASDIILVLSLYLDPFPNINLEAMACGRPVIGTKYGGTSEAVIDGYNGYIVDPYDLRSVTEKTMHLLSDPDRIKQFGQNGYTRLLREFSIDKHLENLLKWYSE